MLVNEVEIEDAVVAAIGKFCKIKSSMPNNTRPHIFVCSFRRPMGFIRRLSSGATTGQPPPTAQYCKCPYPSFFKKSEKTPSRSSGRTVPNTDSYATIKQASYAPISSHVAPENGPGVSKCTKPEESLVILSSQKRQARWYKI